MAGRHSKKIGRTTVMIGRVSYYEKLGGTMKQERLIWSLTAICMGIVLLSTSFAVGLFIGLQNTDAMTLLRCQNHFDSLMENATSSCIRQVKDDVNWTGIMEECQKCKCMND
jgi:hypothetical protein